MNNRVYCTQNDAMGPIIVRIYTYTALCLREHNTHDRHRRTYRATNSVRKCCAAIYSERSERHSSKPAYRTTSFRLAFFTLVRECLPERHVDHLCSTAIRVPGWKIEISPLFLSHKLCKCNIRLFGYLYTKSREHSTVPLVLRCFGYRIHSSRRNIDHIGCGGMTFDSSS